MTPLRRSLDILYALALCILLAPLILYLALLVWIKDGRPVLYKAERMKAPGQPFLLWKFRTMRSVDRDAGVSGGDKEARITPNGAWMRRKRMDEIPQLLNILRGDISFVGPRPPLRRYVEMYPELYARVLQDRPGLSGLATLAFHQTEERLLANTKTAQETEDVYCRRCIPRKAALDILYASRRNVCSDFRILLATLSKKITMHRR